MVFQSFPVFVFLGPEGLAVATPRSPENEGKIYRAFPEFPDSVLLHSLKVPGFCPDFPGKWRVALQKSKNRFTARGGARPPDAPCQPPRRAAPDGASHAAAPPLPPAGRAPQYPRHLPEILVNFPGNGSENGKIPGKTLGPKNWPQSFSRFPG